MNELKHIQAKALLHFLKVNLLELGVEDPDNNMLELSYKTLLEDQEFLKQGSMWMVGYVAATTGSTVLDEETPDEEILQIILQLNSEEI